jgi:hypothetical protein
MYTNNCSKDDLMKERSCKEAPILKWIEWKIKLGTLAANRSVRAVNMRQDGKCENTG